MSADSHDVLVRIDQEKERYLEELMEYLRIPSVSTDPAHQDDVLRCADFVTEKLRSAGLSAEIIETFNIQTPNLMFDCQVGDMVMTNPESRDLLACRSDNRSTSRISRVRMDFEKQCTNLRIVRQRDWVS